MNGDKHRRGKSLGYTSGLAAFLMTPASRQIRMPNSPRNAVLLFTNTYNCKLVLQNKVVSLYTTSLNIHKFYIMSTERIRVFCMVLKTIIECFLT